MHSTFQPIWPNQVERGSSPNHKAGWEPPGEFLASAPRLAGSVQIQRCLISKPEHPFLLEGSIQITCIGITGHRPCYPLLLSLLSV